MFDYFLNIYLVSNSYQIQVTKEEADDMVKWYHDYTSKSDNYVVKHNDGEQRYTNYFKREHITAITVWERPKMIDEVKYH